MLNVVLIAIIFATLIVMYLIIQRDRNERDNRIAFIKQRASYIDNNVDARERARDHVGVN